MKQESHSWIEQPRTDDLKGTTIKPLRCERCGVTGLRYGAASAVKLAPSFRASIFTTCNDACKEACKEAVKRQTSTFNFLS